MLTRNKARATSTTKVVQSFEVSWESCRTLRSVMTLESLATDLRMGSSSTHMFQMMFLKANESTSARALITALLTSLCLRIVLFCRATISAKRGCLKVPGEGFASTGFEDGVVGAVVGVGMAWETAETAEDMDCRAEDGMSVVDVEDMALRPLGEEICA